MDAAFLNDLLECSVCLEQLDSTSKVLPCQHTFCKQCLEEIVNSHKELRCPECRVRVETKIDELPCNILLIRLLEGIKNNARIPKSSRENGRKATAQQPQTSVVHSSPTSQLVPAQGIVGLQDTDAGKILGLPKQFGHVLPCAKALYAYDAKEPGDLAFKKGDIIVLKKRIDQNWYHGELNSKSGYLPASYVQVLAPMPHIPPQCKALYDFCISRNDEQDCLTFSKGDILTVIRRIDENWAEGKLGEKVGIFPVSFVQMNTAARTIMKLSANTFSGPSRIAPPTPTSETVPRSEQLTPCTVSSVAVVAANDSSTTTSPSPNSSSHSPGTPCSSSASSSSPVPVVTLSNPETPSSILPTPTSTLVATPSHHPSSVPVPHLRNASSSSSHHHNREKRLSLASTTQLSPQATAAANHRHSLEILNSDCGPAEPETPAKIVSGTTAILTVVTSAACSTASNFNTSHISTLSPGQVLQGSTDAAVNSRGNRRSGPRKEKDNYAVPVLKTDGNINSISSASAPNINQASTFLPSCLPVNHAGIIAYYVALYNYKPQKEDELELRKGELYTVSEKCQDGWFKGTSITTGRSGVFPGNYVHLAKASVLQSQFSQPSGVANVRSMVGKVPVTSSGIALPSSHTRQRSLCSNVPLLQQPTEILEHRKADAEVQQTPWVKNKDMNQAGMTHGSSNAGSTAALHEWVANHHAAATSAALPPKPHAVLQAQDQLTPKSEIGKGWSKPWHVAAEHSSLPAQVASSSSSSSDSGPSSLITARTDSNSISTAAPVQPTMAASYPATSIVTAAPGPAASHEGFTSSAGTTGGNQSWHGPSLFSSMLMSTAATAVTPPNVSVTAADSTDIPSLGAISASGPRVERKKDKEKVSLMKRLTSKRRSRSPPPSNYSCDNPSFVDTPPHYSGTPHKPSPVVHIRSGSCPSEAFGSQNTNHKKSNSLDGTLAAANETPKSYRSKQPPPLVRERFRCIVPYPPNSDLELELKVGDIVYVHKKRDDGWYKGTLQRTGKTGLFPASFVDSY